MSPVNALKTTFAIVQVLARKGGASVSSIAQEIDTPKSTVHDHLSSLEELEYAVNDGNAYRLSSRWVEIGTRIRDRNPVFNVAKNQVDELADRTGEHVSLFIEEQGMATMLYTAKGENAIDIIQFDGMRFSPHSNAAGKAMLAYMNWNKVDEILSSRGMTQMTENTITDRNELIKELERIRERGYSLENQEYIEGVRAVAMPIDTPTTEPASSLTIYGPASRLEGTRFTEEIPDLLRRATNIIEVTLTHG